MDSLFLVGIEVLVRTGERLFGDEVIACIAEADNLGGMTAGVMKRDELRERVGQDGILDLAFEPAAFVQLVAQFFPSAPFRSRKKSL